ncbi:hypothetical protein [uncultured Rothia sp.]|uniref:hypothetical protein n=1 Tax=uncultured Rothia sp. TaxID=316088 RepID=UPI002632B569|nr:hypothetical protein [uncultured Rothia sp.]
MAKGVVRLSDVIVPEIFNPYVQLRTTELSNLVQAGVITLDARLNSNLAGEGLTFNVPFFKDLDQDEENISNDDPAVKSTPNKIGTGQEVQIRLSRNNSWSSMDLTADLLAHDPMTNIGNRLATYWSLRLQRAFLAVAQGVFAHSETTPAGGSTHTAKDLTHDIKGTTFVEGTTTFGGKAFIDTLLTMGDHMGDLSIICVHSLVYGQMRKNNMIDFIPVSINGAAQSVPTFQGLQVVVNDNIPVKSDGTVESWLFARGAFALGTGSAKTPTETWRDPAAGNGSGQEVLFNRVEWALHPVGYAYIGTAAAGGPNNATLAAAASWKRVFPERKMIKMARLITREFK